MENKILIDSVNKLKVALNEISVYDFDVYTSMELYYKIAENFNKVIKELNRFEGVISEEVVKQNEKLLYLLGEGLNIEVVDKINEMVEKGVFDTIINHNIFNNLKNDINNVNSQLEQKANKNQVFSMVNMGQDIKEAMTGGSVGVVGKHSILSINIIDEQVVEDKTTFFNKTIGKNLFNPNSEYILRKKYIQADGTILDSVNDDRFITDYIPVNEGKELKVSYEDSNGDRSSLVSVQKYCVYNESLQVLENEGSNSPGSYYRNNKSSGKKYVRFTIMDSYAKNCQIEEIDIGFYETSYEPYNATYKLNEKYLSNKNSWFNNKKLATFGDSVTAQAKWQQYIVSKLGLTSFSNYGKGGTRVADTNNDSNSMCRDERINLIDTTNDIILFMGGLNDWAQSVQLGDINSTDVTTFYGALNVMTQKLLNKFPTKLIVYMTTTYGMYPNYQGWNDTTGLKNSLNLTTLDYGKCIQEVARLHGIPCIDLGGKSGWNKYNINNYVTNDGALLHPNDEGGKKIASIVIGELKQIEPI